jgi:pimeloyl-ACP methyl ester carboxylesterase
MIAAELKAILEAAGEDGPYILVGHAFGGVYLRIFAGQYPEDVAGMVLIESGHPEMLTRFEALDLVREIPEKSIRPLIWLLSHLGSPSREGGIDYDLSEGVEDPVRAFLPESSMAWYDEMVEAPATLAQAGVYDVLGDFPLIVIAASKPPVSVDRGEELDQLWLELQGELVALSTEGELRVYQTGHYPQYQSPEIVIQAVLDVLERAGT